MESTAREVGGLGTSESALGSLRVLDFTDARGLLCGQMLADLGADVVQVEPPAGSSARRCGPFVDDEERDTETSFRWWAYARNKRSVTLDLETEAGRSRAHALARHADFVIESSSPGEMEALGLGYDALARDNPAIIVVSITPFGQSGPKAMWAASDLTVEAAAGNLLLQGDADRAPVRVSFPQAFLHAAAEAAVGAMTAFVERTRSGRGQHVDVSAQQAVLAATQSDVLCAAVGDVASKRAGAGVSIGPVNTRLTYPAKDGHVSITHGFGPTFGPSTSRIMHWVYELGGCDDALRDTDFVRYGARLLGGEVSVAEFEDMKERVARATGAHSKQALLALALERKLLMAPSASIRDLLDSEQFEALLLEQERPDGRGKVSLPGPYARLSRTPLSASRRAPRLGEHTAEVERDWLAMPGPTRSGSDGAGTGLPFEGLKVVDLAWAIAGPTVGRVLADYGAEVVRIESAGRPDPNRGVRPFINGRFGGERAALMHNMNAGKLQLGLDLSKPGAIDVVLDLVRRADVVLESFVPGTVDRLGLGYEKLCEVKPDVILLSSSLMGCEGPLARFAGFGNLGAAFAGMLDLTGWPDRAPVGPYAAYTDYIAPRFGATALLAALEHRRRTGEGQFIDLSQVEASVHFLAPLLAETSATGRVSSRRGNADFDHAPHGVYPVRGEDRWIAIAVTSDAEWSALCEVLDLEAGADTATAAARRAHSERLDAEVAEATAPREGAELEAALQERGIPSHRLQASADLVRDPQLLHREHFVSIEHPLEEGACVEASRFQLSRTPARRPTLAPTLGFDNHHILSELLAYDDERITALALAEALD